LALFREKEIIIFLFVKGCSCYFGGDLVNLADGRYRQNDDLQVGDRIWSLAKDGKTLVEDKMILMMHVESTSSSIYLLISKIGMIRIDCFIHSSLLYTFTTSDGHFLSLSGNHSIAILDIQSNKTF
jgi:hypothetical protein